MENVLHKNKWNQGEVHVHVEPPPILSIKSKNDDELGKCCVKIKLRTDPTS